MRCILCLNLSFQGICDRCRRKLLKPSLFKRKLKSEFYVYSFYPYNEIEQLLLTKHTDIGHKVYKSLAKAIAPFVAKLLTKDTTLLALEGEKISPYSHTALVQNELRKLKIDAPQGVMIDISGAKYSGKPLSYRITNPRNFTLSKHHKINKKVALFDDIVTTGTTFENGLQKLISEGFSPLFCVALSDARNIS